MTPETISKLERMKYRSTRYEVIAENTERKIRVGFTLGKSGRKLRDLVCARAERLLADMGLPETAQFDFGKTEITGNGWTIRFTGQTERDCVRLKTV